MFDEKRTKQLIFTTEYINEITDRINNGYIVRGRESPWLDGNKVGILRSKLPFSRTEEEKIEYLKCSLGEDENGFPFIDPNTQKLKTKAIHYFVNKYGFIKREDGSFGPIQIRDYQYEMLDLFAENRFSILMASRQVGKCVTATTKIKILENNTIKVISFYELFYKFKKKKDFYDHIKYGIYRILNHFESNLLYKFISYIEKKQYKKNKNKKEKLIESIKVEENIKVFSDTGFVPIKYVHLTKPFQIYEIILENRIKLKCADEHILFKRNKQTVFCKDLKVGDELITETGALKIISLRKLEHEVFMYDLTLESNEKRYYTNGILSHNTVMMCLCILWYCFFHNDKNVMIIANKRDTVVEIIDKIKAIYKAMPVWLKPGVDVWNTKSIVFGDTGCRILTSARSKEPAIGFTIDLLYLDEFAHIPRNIIEPYYKAAYPTVASVKNSKIVITSTPNGKNLFWKLYTGATEEKNHPFKALRIPWDRVKGRHVTYVRIDNNVYSQYQTTKEEILEEIKKFQPSAFLEWSSELNMFVVHVYNNIDLTPDDVRKKIITIQGKPVKIIELGEVISWRELEIKAIGSVEAFNQEYGLQFLAGNKRILEPETVAEVEASLTDFVYIPLDELVENPFKHCVSDYSDLKFIQDNNLFDIFERKKYRIWISIDLAEGLKKDYSVINIFLQTPLSYEEIKNQKIDDVRNAFRLVQVGIWRSNTHSISEVGEILYNIVFNFFDPDRVKIVLEMNKNFGNLLLKEMQNLYKGENEFGTYPFLRYKHNINDQKTKIGLLVSGGEGVNSLSSRPAMIRDYVDKINKKRIIVKEKETIEEVIGFVKEILPSGRQIWVSDTGHDDCVATIINLTTIFEKIEWQNACEELLEEEPELNKILYENIQLSDNALLGGYDGLKTLNKKYL